MNVQKEKRKKNRKGRERSNEDREAHKGRHMNTRSRTVETPAETEEYHGGVWWQRPCRTNELFIGDEDERAVPGMRGAISAAISPRKHGGSSGGG